MQSRCPGLKKSFRVGFCVSGAGRLFQAAAERAEVLSIIPALVIAEQTADPNVRLFCEKRGIAFGELPRSSRCETQEFLFNRCVAAELDLLVLTFDKIIGPELVRHYRSKIINVHPSLLPALPGRNALSNTVKSGVRFAGATIHEVDELTDHGPIIAQCVEGVRAGDSEETLGIRLFPLMRLMYIQVISWYAQGRVQRNSEGKLEVLGGDYGAFPISPAVEEDFV